MSRQTATKTRTEKGGKTTSAPTPAVTHDIVSGKYTDQDWHLMLDHDDGDEMVIDIVEDITSAATDIIYEKYLEKQLIPYIVLQAKDAILQITEWQFLQKDDGETEINSDPAWTADEEPAAATTDCWAQGSVPRILASDIVSRPPTVLEEEEIDEDTVTEQQSEEDNFTAEENLSQNKQMISEELQESEIQITPEQSDMSTQESESNTNTKRKKFKTYKGKLGSANINKITESLDQSDMQQLWDQLSPLYAQSPEPDALQMPNSCQSIVKLQAGRPPGNREVIYDNAGNVISVNKINPARLPSHRVKTNFKVVDPTVEAAQAQLEAMRTGRYIKGRVPQPPKTQPKGNSTRIRGAATLTQLQSRDAVAPLPPPLLEIMELSPGVSVKEGDRIKKGPRQYSRKAGQASTGGSFNLRPVTLKANANVITVEELIDRQSPIVRPFQESPPIPPIRPHPPSQVV